MAAYYNDNDPQVSAWLRELMRRGLITDGEVDERSIADVTVDDVRGFTRCHFFAGIGGWDLALQLAGWPDERPVWTGSPPCQPFSAAGKREGASDERHLAPVFLDLVGQCRPPVLFGEQVSAAVGVGWFDAFRADLEHHGYRCGGVIAGAHSVGAPHIRQRLWIVADSSSAGSGRDAGTVPRAQAQGGGERGEPGDLPDLSESDGGVGNAADHGREFSGHQEYREQQSPCGLQPDGSSARRPWDRADWLPCLDGKARPVEPGVEPLAHGIPARVVRLRGYGNAIVPQVAAQVIGAYLETEAT